MSFFLEILGCILCCEEERLDDGDEETSYHLLGSGSRFYNSLFRRNSATRNHNPVIHQTDSTSRTITYEQDYGSSSFVISTQKVSNPPPLPSSTSIPNRIVIGSRTSNSSSTGYAAERINQVSQNFKDPSASLQKHSNYAPPPTSKPPQSLPKSPSTSSHQSPFLTVSSPKPPAASLISCLSAPKAPTSSSKPATPFNKPPPSSPKPPSSSSKPSSSSFGPPTSSPMPAPSFKVTLSPTCSGQTDKKNKTEYVSNEKDLLPIYIIPEDIKDLIEKDIVPGVLCKPLSPSTYTDYFAALLYAEDDYLEKWSDFQLKNTTLELREASIYRKLSNKKLSHESDEKKDALFAVFKVDSIPERRPFLLSRDFVFAKPTGKVDPFQGIINRVEKSTTVLVKFGEEFYSQHHRNCKYDISFSFNRVCLKRAHQAVSAASDPLFRDYLFPDCLSQKRIATSASLLSSNYKLDPHQNSAVSHILSFQGAPPYLIEGPPCVSSISKNLSESGMVVQDAVLKIYMGSPQSRILICAPINSTCDVLVRSLKAIHQSHIFRANAAFREVDEVPEDILPSCDYKGECFSCPSLQKLKTFRVILSTFVSSFRLHNEGITAGHFSHIFLVDASSATEPETMIALTNLANEKTAVIVTGTPGNYPGWVRSDVARNKGLRVSYFERLRLSKSYSSLDSHSW